VLVGVLEGVGELLAEAEGLGVALGVAEDWLGVGEDWLWVGVGWPGGGDTVPPLGVAGWLCATTAPVTRPADAVFAAITTPATIATTPTITPATSDRTVQVEAGCVPGVGRLPVNGCLSGAGLARGGMSLPAPSLVAAALARVSGVSAGQAQGSAAGRAGSPRPRVSHLPRQQGQSAQYLASC
jgi:hypothetical protein